MADYKVTIIWEKEKEELKTNIHVTRDTEKLAESPMTGKEEKLLNEYLANHPSENTRYWRLTRSKRGNLLLRNAGNPDAMVNLTAGMPTQTRATWMMDEAWAASLKQELQPDVFPDVLWKDYIREITVTIRYGQNLCVLHVDTGNSIPGVSLPDLTIETSRRISPEDAVRNVIESCASFPAVLDADAEEVGMRAVKRAVQAATEKYGVSEAEAKGAPSVCRYGGNDFFWKIDQFLRHAASDPTLARSDVPGKAVLCVAGGCRLPYNPWNGEVDTAELEDLLRQWKDMDPWQVWMDQMDAEKGDVDLRRAYLGIDRGWRVQTACLDEKVIASFSDPNDATTLKGFLKALRTGNRNMKLYAEAEERIRGKMPAFPNVSVTCVPENGNMSYTLKGHYTTSESGIINYHASYIAAFTKHLKEYAIKEDAAVEAHTATMRKSPLYGFLPGLAIAKMVHRNSRFITEKQAIGLLRGTSVSMAASMQKTGKEGAYNLIPADQMHAVTCELIEAGILSEKMTYGKYADYYILRETEKTEEYLATGGISKEKDPMKMTDCELLHWLHSGDSDIAQDQIPDLIARLIERPQLFCEDSSAFLAWFIALPERFQVYLKATYEAENDRYKRKLMRKILAAIKAGAAESQKPHVSSVKPKPPETWHVEELKSLSSWNNRRYAVVDNATGKVLDNAQGYGYKSVSGARAAWRYKTRDRSKDTEKAAREQAIRSWMKEHKSFVRTMDQYAFEIAKGSWGPDDKMDAGLVKQMLEENDLHPDFTPGQLLAVWRKS